jgi:hypothetical protein
MNIRLLIQNIGTKTLSENCPDNSSLYLICDSERESIMVTHRENEGDARVVMSCSYEDDIFFGNIGLMDIDDEFMFGEELEEYLDMFDLDASLLLLVEGEL